MSDVYFRKTRGIFDPTSQEPFKLSRSKIDLFTECPRCFYLDRRLGVSRPSIPAFTLNSAVDHLLKKEFDLHRAEQTAHPLMEEFNINAVPFDHPDIETWRHNFTGIQYHHKKTNFLVFGAVDDIWVNPSGELHVVDYKSTSKEEKPTLDGRWQEGYKRQVEVYQWLLRGNGFTVSDTAYFVYVNGDKGKPTFDGKLEFDTDIIAYTGDDGWIEPTLQKAKQCLVADVIPEAGDLCEYCPYRDTAGKVLKETYLQSKKKQETPPLKETLF